MSPPIDWYFYTSRQVPIISYRTRISILTDMRTSRTRLTYVLVEEELSSYNVPVGYDTSESKEKGGN